MRGHRDRDGGVDPRQLLDRDRVRERVGAGAAVLLRDGDAHQPELGHLLDELVREAVFAVELRGNGLDPLGRELAHGAAQELVLVREVEVHAKEEASSTSRRTP